MNYYGKSDNYIHIKFGDVRKWYNFTGDFTNKYPNFVREFVRYCAGGESKFKSPFAVVSYVYDNSLPVGFYFNFTETPARSRGEIVDYLVRENSYVHNLTD